MDVSAGRERPPGEDSAWVRSRSKPDGGRWVGASPGERAPYVGRMRHHDLVVIGAGSGNAVVDDSFADLDVAVVEERWFGGTCLNSGCIPSKMLAYTARVARTVREAGRYDVDAELGAVHWRQMRDRVFGRLDAERDSGRRGRAQEDSVTVYEGRARFVGPRSLRIEGERGAVDISAGQIVVAVGGRPLVPGPVAESGLPYETSDTVMRIDAPPRRLAILGGGYIAAELAEVFMRHGKPRHRRGEGGAPARPTGRDGRGALHGTGPLPLRPSARPGTHCGRRRTGCTATDPGRRNDGRGGHASRRGGPGPEQ